MLQRVVIGVAALAIVIPSAARADHEISRSYISSMLVSLVGGDPGIGAVQIEASGRPATITITDSAPAGFISATACQNVDGDTTHCEPGEPIQHLCVRNGEPVALNGFEEQGIHVWIYTTGAAGFSPACDASLATTGTVTIGFEH